MGTSLKPVAMTPFVFDALNKATDHLVSSLLNEDICFKLRLHHSFVNQAGAGSKMA